MSWLAERCIARAARSIAGAAGCRVVARDLLPGSERTSWSGSHVSLAGGVRLRRKITVAFFLVSTLVSVVLAVFLYRFVERQLETELRDQLRSIAHLGARTIDTAAYRRLTARTRELTEEKQTSERLLLNVPPGPIAERLKTGEHQIVDRF
jgi:hypothetical protein